MKMLCFVAFFLAITLIISASSYSCVFAAETLPWGVERIRAYCVWDNDFNMIVDNFANAGDYVSIAVIDSGVDYYVNLNGEKVHHPDLEDNIVFGKGFELVGSEVVERDDYQDATGHGTMVTGVMAAVDNTIGVIGVAPKAKIYVLKFIGYPWTHQQLAYAINYAANNLCVRVIVMSLTTMINYTDVYNACQNAYCNRGALLVAAAGNENSGVRYPAKYEFVIAVGAVNEADQRWIGSDPDADSNFGPELEFVAPGVDIYSTTIGSYLPEGNYGTDTGTSFACPHVAAVAALIWRSKIDPDYDLDKNGYWSNGEVRLKLRHMALDLGQAGKDDYYGYGLINAWAVNQRPLGDINNDLSVNYRDGIILGGAFGSRPGDVNWDPRADINIDNIVNFLDSSIIGNNFGKTDP